MMFILLLIVILMVGLAIADPASGAPLIKGALKFLFTLVAIIATLVLAIILGGAFFWTP